MNGWMPRHMAPGNQSLYMHLSLKIRGIIKLLSQGVGLRSVLARETWELFFRVRACVCVCAWEGHTVTEIDGEGKAGHYVV